jgi:hypothetical protein
MWCKGTTRIFTIDSRMKMSNDFELTFFPSLAVCQSVEIILHAHIFYPSRKTYFKVFLETRGWKDSFIDLSQTLISFEENVCNLKGNCYGDKWWKSYLWNFMRSAEKLMKEDWKLSWLYAFIKHLKLLDWVFKIATVWNVNCITASPSEINWRNFAMHRVRERMLFFW